MLVILRVEVYQGGKLWQFVSVSECRSRRVQGMVEKWLLEVEETMVMSIRDVIRQSVNAYAVTQRKQWVIEWPGQVAICVSCIYWTGEVTEAMGVINGMQVTPVTCHVQP